MKEFQAFKIQLGVLASRLDFMYKQLASNLLRSLLKAHDSSGTCLNKSQFSGEDLKNFNVVFCEKTFKKPRTLGPVFLQ